MVVFEIVFYLAAGKACRQPAQINGLKPYFRRSFFISRIARGSLADRHGSSTRYRDGTGSPRFGIQRFRHVEIISRAGHFVRNTARVTMGNRARDINLMFVAVFA